MAQTCLPLKSTNLIISRDPNDDIWLHCRNDSCFCFNLPLPLMAGLSNRILTCVNNEKRELCLTFTISHTLSPSFIPQCRYEGRRAIWPVSQTPDHTSHILPNTLNFRGQSLCCLLIYGQVQQAFDSVYGSYSPFLHLPHIILPKKLHTAVFQF